MSTRDAEFRPYLDIVDVAGIGDLTPAATSLLQNIDSRQHALMTGWGNPPIARSTWLRSTSGPTSWTIPLRVPPGVTEVDFGLLVWGIGSITATCSADATGFELWSDLPTDESRAEWIWTSGAVDSASGASSGRALTVSASVVWTYQVVDITLTLDDITTECGIAGYITAPVWRPVTL